MANQKETAILQWLATEFGQSLSRAVESMAGSSPAHECDGVSRPFEASEDALYCEQEFSLRPGCAVYVATPEPVWRELGAMVLKAAGLEDVGRDDAISTFQEILSQAFGGIAQGLTSRMGREVTCGAKADRDSLPATTTGLAINVALPGTNISTASIFLTATPDLISEIQAASDPAAPAMGARPDGSALSSISKTFDLLLGVHLPVSVSFGKTHMMVKEVLKLTTGSIVELDRQVTEPVDIIVNNCIIARGEVVVISGNYGVRVKEIVSKEQRYETGARMALRTVR